MWSLSIIMWRFLKVFLWEDHLSCNHRLTTTYGVSLHQILREIVDHWKPSLCSLDVLSPSWNMLSFLNKCLSTGTIPDILKQATTPLLKKPSLDDRNYNHFPPISTLPLTTKALEKTVLNQLHFFHSTYQILETFQSGLSLLHSTHWVCFSDWCMVTLWS